MTKISYKAAALAALYQADQAGALDGLTQEQIARALGLAHRSAGGRYLHDLQALRALVPELAERLRTVHQAN